MKKYLSKLGLALLLTAVSAPYCIRGFDISAYSNKLMDFNGTKISGGIASNGSFVVKNDYAVVHMTNSKYDGTKDGWPTPSIYNALRVDLRIKGTIGYSPIATKYFDSGSYTTEYVAHKGQRYDLYFSSANYNFWNSKGAVYANK